MGTDQASDQVESFLNEQVQRLLDLMGEDWWRAQALMQLLGLSHRPTFRKNYLNPALAAEQIVMLYPDKPRSPKQKYHKA